MKGYVLCNFSSKSYQKFIFNIPCSKYHVAIDHNRHIYLHLRCFQDGGIVDGGSIGGSGTSFKHSPFIHSYPGRQLQASGIKAVQAKIHFYTEAKIKCMAHESHDLCYISHDMCYRSCDIILLKDVKDHVTLLQIIGFMLHIT